MVHFAIIQDEGFGFVGIIALPVQVIDAAIAGEDIEFLKVYVDCNGRVVIGIVFDACLEVIICTAGIKIMGASPLTAGEIDITAGFFCCANRSGTDRNHKI